MGFDFSSLIPVGLPQAGEASSHCAVCQQVCRTDTACDQGWVELDAGGAGQAALVAPCKQWQALLKGQADAAGLHAAGLDDARYAQDWADLNTNHKSWQAARSIAANIGPVIRQGLNVVAVGPTGTGKTHAAVLVCRAAQAAGHTALKLDWSRFLDGLRDGYNDRTQEPEGKKLDRVCAADILLLDDIAAGGDDNKYSTTRLEKIITRRYDAQKPTILTANLTPRGLHELLGDRAASRINGRVIEITFNGERYREKTERQEVNGLIQAIWSGKVAE